jgi:hypothetical protein
MRYAVRRYFSQTHGWIVRGFSGYEEQGNASVVGDSDVLQTKLPGYIASLLEDRFGHSGFSLDAVVALVATVERMNFDEVVQGVELAFDLNDIEPTRALSINDLFEVISSFLIVEIFEGTDNKKMHQHVKTKSIWKRYPHWGTTILLIRDAIGSDMFQRQASSNPFTSNEVHSFEDAARISGHISEQFAAWTDHECQAIKDELVEMDVHDTGRVKLSDFYSHKKEGIFFEEPSAKLRQYGILDESSTWLGPQVMIPNYITSMVNCITTKPYYQICCLSECDLVFQQLESRIAAPSATVPEIINALESGTHASASISALHRERLAEIARVHDNQVPLYGRLFARWLHFVYPQECPYPHAEGVFKQMTQREYKALVGAQAAVVRKPEIAQHLEADFARQAPSPDAGATMWSLEESLLESSTPSDSAASPIWKLLRIAIQIGMLAGFLSMLRPLMQMLRSEPKGKLIEYNV